MCMAYLEMSNMVGIRISVNSYIQLIIMILNPLHMNEMLLLVLCSSLSGRNRTIQYLSEPSSDLFGYKQSLKPSPSIFHKAFLSKLQDFSQYEKMTRSDPTLRGRKIYVFQFTPKLANILCIFLFVRYVADSIQLLLNSKGSHKLYNYVLDRARNCNCNCNFIQFIQRYQFASFQSQI